MRSWAATFFLYMQSSLLRDREILSCYFLLIYTELATGGSWDLELPLSTYIYIASYWGIVRSWVAAFYLYMQSSLLRDREILSCYLLLIYVELTTDGSRDLELLPSTYICRAHYWWIVRSDMSIIGCVCRAKLLKICGTRIMELPFENGGLEVRQS